MKVLVMIVWMQSPAQRRGNEMTFFTYLKFFLYFIFGFVLSVSGISILEKPLEFLIILGLFIAVDITSKLEK